MFYLTNVKNGKSNRQLSRSKSIVFVRPFHECELHWNRNSNGFLMLLFCIFEYNFFFKCRLIYLSVVCYQLHTAVILWMPARTRHRHTSHCLLFCLQVINVFAVNVLRLLLFLTMRSIWQPLHLFFFLPILRFFFLLLITPNLLIHTVCFFFSIFSFRLTLFEMNLKKKCARWNFFALRHEMRCVWNCLSPVQIWNWIVLGYRISILLINGIHAYTPAPHTNCQTA